ncbi:MAG: hypothetical protein NT007_03720 [Candidatus Kapabacteria bacterium]|nr:hypothetical protein [Candidatus Kapabacteria bacterium]
MEQLVESLSIKDFKAIIKSTVEETLQNNIEDIIAFNSPNYINSIEEAREDYKSGNFVNLKDLINV